MLIFFVSGTASIIGAETVYAGNIEMQTITTIENIIRLISENNLKQYEIENNLAETKFETNKSLYKKLE